MAVDPETYRRYLLVEKKARDLGLSAIEALDHAQLLLTAKRRHNLEVQALQELCRRLDRQSPNKLLSHFYGRTEGTAGEMFEAMKLWIEAVVRNQANGTLEEL
jgi:DNA-binding Xre family transcriptional regulator